MVLSEWPSRKSPSGAHSASGLHIVGHQSGPERSQSDERRRSLEHLRALVTTIVAVQNGLRISVIGSNAPTQREAFA